MRLKHPWGKFKDAPAASIGARQLYDQWGRPLHHCLSKRSSPSISQRKPNFPTEENAVIAFRGSSGSTACSLPSFLDRQGGDFCLAHLIVCQEVSLMMWRSSISIVTDMKLLRWKIVHQLTSLHVSVRPIRLANWRWVYSINIRPYTVKTENITFEVRVSKSLPNAGALNIEQDGE